MGMICQSRQRLSSTNFTWSILKYLVDTAPILKYVIETSTIVTAINLWQRCVSCKSQSSNLLYKLMDWFLYDRVNLVRHERVKVYELISTNSRSCFHKYVFTGSKGFCQFQRTLHKLHLGLFTQNVTFLLSLLKACVRNLLSNFYIFTKW